MKKIKIILLALISILVFTACSSNAGGDIPTDDFGPDVTTVDDGGTDVSGGDIDDDGGTDVSGGDIDDDGGTDVSDGDIDDGGIDINDIFKDTYWVTRTGNVDEEMAMSIHPNLMYGYNIATGNLSGGDIQEINIVDNNTVFVSTILSDGNGSVDIDYRIWQTEPGVITITERWLKTPAYENISTYYQITEEEYSNL